MGVLCGGLLAVQVGVGNPRLRVCFVGVDARVIWCVAGVFDGGG